MTRVAPTLPRVHMAIRSACAELLWNLLTNAVKYTVAGDEVEVSARKENGSVAVFVRDHGLGIPPDAQELIFEKLGA